MRYPLLARLPIHALVCLVLATALAEIARGDFLATDALNDQILRYSDSGALKGAFVQPGAGDLNAPFSMTWGPDGNLYVGGSNASVLVYDGKTGAFIRKTPGLNGRIFGLLFTPDGDLLASGPDPYRMVRLDPATGAIKATITAPSLYTPGKMIMAPDGRVIVGGNGGAGSGKNGIFKLDLNTNTLEEFVAPGLINGAFGFDYGPDGMLYAAALNSGYDVYRIDPITGDVLGVFAENTTSVAALDVLFVNGNRLWVPGLLSGNMSRFDARSGEFQLEVSAGGQAFDLLHMPEPSCLGLLLLGYTLLGRGQRRSR